MFTVELMQKVIEGCSQRPGDGIGWLTKYLKLPFVPIVGMDISFPFWEASIMPSANKTVRIEQVSWNDRDQKLFVLAKPHYLIDLARPEFADTDLSAYLKQQVEHAWDSCLREPDLD